METTANTTLSWVIGLPVVIELASDGTLTVRTDLSEAADHDDSASLGVVDGGTFTEVPEYGPDDMVRIRAALAAAGAEAVAVFPARRSA